MDGSNRRTLHSTNSSHSVGLALDIQNQILYWSNGYRQLESSNLDGTNRLIITESVYTNHLAVLEPNVIYIRERLFNIRRINITDGATTRILERMRCDAGYDGALQIVDQLKQPVGML